MVPLTLAVATDALLKNEFDVVRKSALTHPLWIREQLNVRAFDHPDIDTWRNNLKGIHVNWKASDIEIFGAVDDLWLLSVEHLPDLARDERLACARACARARV